MTDEAEPIGRAKGGIARRDALSASKRRKIARDAASARWAGGIKHATHGSPDHPLKIGNIEIPCYVLDDETRVLSQRGVLGGLGMSQGTAGGGADRLVAFSGGKTLEPFISKELMVTITNPIKFRPPGGGKLAYGYPATILADLCDAVLAARLAGALQKQQQHIAERCEILVRGFARVGIIALVDEATGFQRDRAKDALARVLEAFVAKELQPYVKTFPADYYQQIFRLRGLEYPSDSVRRPQYFGVLTNDVVYKRLAPGVLDELKRVTPKNDAGRPKNKLFRWLTSNIGYPKLREHLGAVVAIMKLSADWHDFMSKLNKLHPRYDAQMSLPFMYEPDKDDGRGL